MPSFAIGIKENVLKFPLGKWTSHVPGSNLIAESRILKMSEYRRECVLICVDMVVIFDSHLAYVPDFSRQTKISHDPEFRSFHINFKKIHLSVNMVRKPDCPNLAALHG